MRNKLLNISKVFKLFRLLQKFVTNAKRKQLQMYVKIFYAGANFKAMLSVSKKMREDKKSTLIFLYNDVYEKANTTDLFGNLNELPNNFNNVIP